MDPGHLIAIQVLLLYVILGPPLIFATYILFDILAKPSELDRDEQKIHVHPSLWEQVDINKYLLR